MIKNWIKLLFLLAFCASCGSARFVRTELYFGCDIPQGGQVSESEWQTFVDTAVSSRFPEGLSILSMLGQWKDSQTGATIQEPSKMLIVFYPRQQKAVSSQRIEEIRASYCQRFGQQAVMRVDSRSRVWFAAKRKSKRFY